MQTTRCVVHSSLTYILPVDAFANEGDSDVTASTVTSSDDVISTDVPAASGRCQVVSSDWTPCSRSCDVGTSVRLSNDNQDCRVETQVRLCLVRPCGVRFPDVSSGPILRNGR